MSRQQNLRQNRLQLGLYMYIMRYSKTANINVKKRSSLKLIVRTMRLYHSIKTAEIFWVTLDVVMHKAAYGRPMRSPI